MSYDIWLQPVGYPDHDDGNWSQLAINYTYNAWRMFEAVSGGSLTDLHGASTEEAASILECAIIGMLVDEAEVRPLEPENGWGSYDGFLEYLRELHRRCATAPGMEVAVG